LRHQVYDLAFAPRQHPKRTRTGSLVPGGIVSARGFFTPESAQQRTLPSRDALLAAHRVFRLHVP
jgi:hypothetical protein